ncbi:hypothetical protein F5Y19DRAFT_184326 [Xylariaceae sp. FL1651]|nr:hypothetical protein F5Y19DRAFT_184326 [Xylariaceae sp. FL1651]
MLTNVLLAGLLPAAMAKPIMYVPQAAIQEELTDTPRARAEARNATAMPGAMFRNHTAMAMTNGTAHMNMTMAQVNLTMADVDARNVSMPQAMGRYHSSMIARAGSTPPTVEPPVVKRGLTPAAPLISDDDDNDGDDGDDDKIDPKDCGCGAACEAEEGVASILTCVEACLKACPDDEGDDGDDEGDDGDSDMDDVKRRQLGGSM